jgi:hypothetical protein
VKKMTCCSIDDLAWRAAYSGKCVAVKCVDLMVLGCYYYDVWPEGEYYLYLLTWLKGREEVKIVVVFIVIILLLLLSYCWSMFVTCCDLQLSVADWSVPGLWSVIILLYCWTAERNPGDPSVVGVNSGVANGSIVGRCWHLVVDCHWPSRTLPFGGRRYYGITVHFDLLFSIVIDGWSCWYRCWWLLPIPAWLGWMYLCDLLLIFDLGCGVVDLLLLHVVITLPLHYVRCILCCWWCIILTT